MKLSEVAGVGIITKQNTTQDVKPGETKRQAKKLGLLHPTAAKNSDPNTLMNLGIGEDEVTELRIEKPDPKDTLGIERKFMPQIKSDDYEEFIEYLTKNGVKFKQETIPASELRAMQKQFSDKGILKQLEKNIAQGPNTKAVIASSDDYILDGHHRWLVAVNTGTDLNVYRVNMPAWRLYDLVNQFQKVYYKDIYDEGKPTVGVPLSSGLTVSIFPHRPLKIKKSTPGKLRYDEGVAITQTPIYEEWSAKYKRSINCNNPKGFSQRAHCAGRKKKKSESVNEAYLLQLENTSDYLVLHVKDTKTGERMEVRGKPGYEIDYDPKDKLHQLLDVIGKASNISELMNGEVVNVNPKHPDGPRSYSALNALMNETVTPVDIQQLERFADKMFAKVGIDVEFGKHFMDRVNDARNKKPITPAELTRLFKQTYQRHGKPIAQMGPEQQAVMKDMRTDVNIPFMLQWDDKNNELDLIAKTVMRKQDFKTSNREFKVEDAQVDEGVNDPHIFKAVFLAGGPGSGKSFVARNILGGTGLRSINSDEVYEYLMKKQGLSLDPETIFSPQGQDIRDKAKGITGRREAIYLDGRLGLIIDGTGKDVNKYKVMAEKLRAIGYDLSMIYVNTSLEVAQQRNKQRERSLEPAKVEQMWNEVQQNLMKFQQIFGAGRFHIIDNSGGLEDLDRQKNFDKVYNETQRFLNTPPSKPKAKQWIQQQKEQNDEKRSATQPTNSQPNRGTSATN